MSDTKIEWTDVSWNPLRGCSKVSAGCANCYAERQAVRYSGRGMPYEGIAADGTWTGRVDLVERKLTEPLRWRKGRRTSEWVPKVGAKALTSGSRSVPSSSLGQFT